MLFIVISFSINDAVKCSHEKIVLKNYSWNLTVNHFVTILLSCVNSTCVSSHILVYSVQLC